MWMVRRTAPRLTATGALSPAASRAYASLMKEQWVRKPLRGTQYDLEISGRAKQGQPFVKVGTVTCRQEVWAGLREYLLKKGAVVIEE